MANEGAVGVLLNALQNKYRITAVDSDTPGIHFMFDEDREELVLLAQEPRIAVVGTNRLNRCYALRIGAEEVEALADELKQVYRLWFEQLPMYNAITSEEAIGYGVIRKKRGRKKKG